MPRGDCTGPLGQGPMTGRELGFCAGYALRTPWSYTLSKDEQIRMLKAEAYARKREQKEIERRLGDLEKEEKN